MSAELVCSLVSPLLPDVRCSQRIGENPVRHTEEVPGVLVLLRRERRDPSRQIRSRFLRGVRRQPEGLELFDSKLDEAVDFFGSAAESRGEAKADEVVALEEVL